MRKLLALCNALLALAIPLQARAVTVEFASTPGLDQVQLAPSLVDADAASALESIDDAAWQPAVACWTYGSWPWLTDSVAPYATWISDTYLVEDAPGSTWRWFRRVVTLPTGASGFSGSVTCTADNAELVYVNGTPIGSDGEVFGEFSPSQEWSTIDSFPVPAEVLQEGENEFLFLVRNYQPVSGDPYGNPTGLIYEVSLSAEWSGFADVGPEHWAYDEVMACADAGIVSGYPDGLYHPDDVLRRSQMAVFISRAAAGGEANVPNPPAGAQTFTDVAAAGFGEDGTDSYWAYRYIEYCAERGIVQGYWDGTYRPEEVVDRGQMAVYIARAVAGGDEQVPEPESGPTFSDVPGAQGGWDWCWRYVEYCAGEGIVQGYWDGTYHPEREVTRDQMAVYVARAFGVPM
jgi:hypothetical protein